MISDIQVVMVARDQSIQDMVDACARGELDYGELCQRVHRMGYNTNSLYYAVVAAKEALKNDQS